LDLDLEADLGIDTVKQAEMFASVRAAFNIPRDENLKLRDFPTLAHVIQFAKERSAAAVATSAPETSSASPKSKSQDEGGTTAPPLVTPSPIAVPRPVPLSLDAANALPRRVPVPMLRPMLKLCKTTGVTLTPGQRVVIMPDQGGVSEALAQRLRESGVEILNLDPQWPSDALVTKLKNWASSAPITGIYWLPALDVEVDASKMDLPLWRESLRVRVKSLHIAMRSLYDQIGRPGTFLVSATRLGGQHGYDEAGAIAPLGGGVVGFTKAFKRERTAALVKAIDFSVESAAGETAEWLIDETLQDPGAVEIGYKMGVRWTIGLSEEPATDGRPGMKLDSGTVFLVTGAAGSIVSAITTDLAAASRGTFYLLDLVPEPNPDNSDLQRFVSDKEGLKRDLFARIQERGDRATPALVEKELAALERAVAARSAIDAVRAAGGTLYYFSVDLTDAEAVNSVVQQVRTRSGHIDVLLHAAGMDRSHSLPDKDAREFNLVFDVKCDGWFNLLDAIGDMPLGATVAFSSIAGRFGNAGQTDYSAANDLLCKLTSNLRRTRPATRGIAIDWTAWDSIGMASRGSIPKVMELAGIDMLPPEAGIPVIRRELTSGATRGEIIVGKRLGMLQNEWDTSGGLDAAAVAGFQHSWASGPMIGTVTAASLYGGLAIQTTLDPKVQPFLYDHQIDGTPVLPGVMGIEAFAEAASWMVPGWHVVEVQDVNFLAPFKFYRNDPRTLTVHAVFRPEGHSVVATCSLVGSRTLPNQPEPQLTTHFTARISLAKELPTAQRSSTPGMPTNSMIDAANIYHLYFHGPAYQVIEHAWRNGEQIIGQMAANLPSNHIPADKPTTLDPRLIELCFQTAGLWEMGALGRLGLPKRLDHISVLRKAQTSEGNLYCVVTPKLNGSTFDAEIIDEAGNLYLKLQGYWTVALSNSVDAEPLKALHAVSV
jgi:NAD(P)-dependent dehydrogenase (short-subunit alcohol dehydrogenase family)